MQYRPRTRKKKPHNGWDESDEYNYMMQREEIEREEYNRICQQLWEEEQRSEQRGIEIWHERNSRYGQE